MARRPKKGPGKAIKVERKGPGKAVKVERKGPGKAVKVERKRRKGQKGLIGTNR